MTHAIADTSVFIAQEVGRELDVAALPDELGVSVVTIGELRAGVLAAPDARLRVRRLATLTSALSLGATPVTEAVAESWAALRMLLREEGKRLPVNDSWIAATAMALGVPVLTQDDDYDVDIPGLDVIRV